MVSIRVLGNPGACSLRACKCLMYLTVHSCVKGSKGFRCIISLLYEYYEYFVWVAVLVPVKRFRKNDFIPLRTDVVGTWSISDATDFRWKVGQAIRWKLQLTNQLEVDTSTEATTAVPLFFRFSQVVPNLQSFGNSWTVSIVSNDKLSQNKVTKHKKVARQLAGTFANGLLSTRPEQP